MIRKKKEAQNLLDETWMRAAFSEAKHGVGWTSPNPAVGAVIVRKGQMIGHGFHRKAGGPHAEIMALQSLKSIQEARGTTLYVTLEPCSTQGRTPACTDAIIKAGFSRVVFGATDPNPVHAGRASKILKLAGIQVTKGILEEECVSLNEGWNKWILTKMPFVVAKVAMTLDGRICSHPQRRWITNSKSRKDAMQLRAEMDAVFIGAETVRIDNPRLTLRGMAPRPQPWRIIWSRNNQLPSDAKVFTDRYRKRTLVVTQKSLKEIFKNLGAQGLCSVLIEGGETVLGIALKEKLIDKFRIYYAPTFFGGTAGSFGGKGVPSLSQALRLTRLQYKCFGDDIRLEAYPLYEDS